ncbi:hypothetical protein A5705_19980 [Mycobacterium sp. E787]|nr:hypothetical protein A5705_19980 [Mycobacterium sp. E787]
MAYVSTPITTGKLYYDWLQASGYKPDNSSDFQRDHAREVIEINKASARALVTMARKRLDKVVVDPTPLDVPDWTQADFHAFWTRLITDYVGTVVFNAGWEYSTGCCFEFAAALDAGAAVLDEKLSPLQPKVGLMLTRRAINRLRKQGHMVNGLLTAREAIEQAVATAASSQEHEV